MTHYKTFSLAGVVLLLFALALTQCTTKSEVKENNIVAELVDSLASTVVESFAQASQNDTAAMVDTEVSRKLTGTPSRVSDFVLADSMLYAASDEGLLVYDFSRKDYSLFHTEEPLRAVALHDGKVYVGGTSLYRLEDTALQRVDNEFAGVITCLLGYGYRLMVGTSDGLYATGIFGDELLLDDVSVTAMAAEGDGLWVGTEGQGLYRWDGDEFRRRFLLRDTSIFDTVFTLAYNHQHLYVGTVNGLHIFDGGRWETYNMLDGLPSDKVIALDASGWVIYLATDEGVVSFYNGDVMPVEKLSNLIVNDLHRFGRKILVATDFEGILLKNGNVLKPLIDQQAGQEIHALSSLSF